MGKINTMDTVVKAANAARLARKSVAQADKFAKRSGEIRITADKRVAKAKELIATLPDDVLAANKQFIGDLTPTAAEVAEAETAATE